MILITVDIHGYPLIVLWSAASASAAPGNAWVAQLALADKIHTLSLSERARAGRAAACAGWPAGAPAAAEDSCVPPGGSATVRASGPGGVCAGRRAGGQRASRCNLARRTGSGC